MKKNEGMCWLVHHHFLVEYCHDYQGRAVYIDMTKPKNERATRLKYFQFVKGELPAEVVQSAQAYHQAKTALDQAWGVIEQAPAARNQLRDTFDQTSDAYTLVLAKYAVEIDQLHRLEQPDCPWDGEKLCFDKPTNHQW